jgi:hypothetical protein
MWSTYYYANGSNMWVVHNREILRPVLKTNLCSGTCKARPKLDVKNVPITERPSLKVPNQPREPYPKITAFIFTVRWPCRNLLKYIPTVFRSTYVEKK